MSVPGSEPTADWAVRYSEYVQKSTLRAARAAELNTTLLTRVAHGELTPANLEAGYASFLADNAAAYADDVAETTMRFLAGLIRSGTSYSHELVERIAPGEFAERPGAAPSFERGDWSAAFQRLTDYAAAENSAAAALLRALMEKVAAGSITPGDMHSLAEDFHGEHVPQTVEQLVTLFFELMTRLDETHADFGNRYLESVLARAAQTEEADATLDLVAPSGQPGSVRFAVSNDEASPTTLRVVMTDVRRADGVGPAFVPDVSIRPERLTLAPGAEEAVSLTVRLDAVTFEPGLEYVATVHVLSPGETVLALPLRIRAAMIAEPGPS